MNTKIKFSISVLLPLLVLILPGSFFHIQGLTIIEQRFIALFFMAALFWVLEPIPVFSTSLLIIFLELIMVSDKGLFFFRTNFSEQGFGDLLSYRDILASFASPIIILFLGGFFLAKVATKYRLDMNLARILIRPFGKKPAYVLLGIMIITAVFSMFMSNTATVAMMLAIAVPILDLFEKSDKGRIALMLSIPFAANIGGIGTPIGTPPNAVALKYLTGSYAIGFGKWMSFGVPYVAVMIVIAWLLLLKLFPSDRSEIELSIRSVFLKNWRAVTVYITFILTILLWLTDFIHGMNSYVVAMLPMVVFCVTGIIGPDDIKQMNWDVLWLIAGGIALGSGLEKSGLSLRVIEMVPFSQFPVAVIVLSASLFAIIMSTFISNTATANLVLPIISALAVSLHSSGTFNSPAALILTVTFSCGLAMSLPVSTPPNAIAYASGVIKGRQMLKAGAVIGAAGLVCAYLFMFILVRIGYI